MPGDDVPWHGHGQVKAIVEQGGGSKLLESMYDALIGGLQKRPSATLIHSTHGAVDETYAKLIHALAPEQAEP